MASDLAVAEYTALQMKKAVVGHGRAAKAQVQEMVRRLLCLPGLPGQDAAMPGPGHHPRARRFGHGAPGRSFATLHAAPAMLDAQRRAQLLTYTLPPPRPWPPPNSALFKYPHGGPPLSQPGAPPLHLPPARPQLLLATVLAFPAGALLWAGAAAGTSSPPARYLQLGPRYLLCGYTIADYGNVRRMALSLLAWHASNSFWRRGGPGTRGSSATKFPTNARKPDKITRNKATKFEKVSARIVEHVRKAAPATPLEDVGA